jgi:hypothetical protein
MANLTVVVDDQVLLQARMRALQQGTSVNAVLRRYLEVYAGGDEKYRQTTERLLELAQASTASSQGRRWSREDIYER